MASLTNLATRVAATLDGYAMLRPGECLGVAVSGGADSVCLLHLLVALAPLRGLRLHVLHLNHHLRGAESDADADFVRDLAHSLGVPATMGDADVARAEGNLEQAARRARLAFFKLAIAGRTVDRVAVGHTRDDQAETVLFRFLRGAGSAGLAGIRPVTSDGLIRPLIEIDRETLRQYLRERSLPWREDGSNCDQRFARNRIRHGLLPELAAEWNPAIAATLAHTARWAQAEESYWEAELDRLSERYLTWQDGAIVIHVPSFEALAEAVRRRLLRRAIERVKGDLRLIDFQHIEALGDLARRPQGHGHASVPGIQAVRSFAWMRLAAPAPPARFRLPVAVPGELRVPGSAFQISLELIEKPETLDSSETVYNNGMGCLDWRRMSSPLELRNWMPGDRYQPLGSRGIEKIKTLFQRARIPIWERRDWPILWDGSSIVWTRRFGPSAEAAADSGSTTILRIRESRIG